MDRSSTECLFSKIKPSIGYFLSLRVLFGIYSHSLHFPIVFEIGKFSLWNIFLVLLLNKQQFPFYHKSWYGSLVKSISIMYDVTRVKRNFFCVGALGGSLFWNYDISVKLNVLVDSLAQWRMKFVNYFRNFRLVRPTRS